MSQSTYSFPAHLQKFIHLILTTCHSNKELFLRELLSNATDALDKIRYKALAGHSIEVEPTFRIRIIPDKTNNTLTIIDTGIGMTKQELIDNLGTLPYQRCRHYSDQDLSEGISQFGLGFHSVFLVSDRVCVISKSDEEEKQYKWEPSDGGTFIVSDDSESVEQLTRGSKIVIYLKEDSREFLEEKRLRDLVRKRLGFIGFPIELQVEKEIERKESKGEEDLDNENVNVKEVITEWVDLNNSKLIWLKNPETVTNEEYSNFYKLITQKSESPLALKHFIAEGILEFKAIVFIPERDTANLLESENKRGSMKLYIRRVPVMDECEELLPEYLGFIKGVVDSDDLPLNISREYLQQNKIMKVMRKNITRRVIELITELTQNTQDYNKFYEQFSRNLKLGIYEDSLNRSKLAELLRFYTSRSDDEQVSLKDYVSRMHERQKEIYYISGKSLNEVASSPYIEQVKKRGYEVIYMIDTVDEYLGQQLKEYDGKKLKNCAEEGFDLDADEAQMKRLEEQRVEYEEFCGLVKEVLGDKIGKVVIGTRISDSPCAVISPQQAWSAGLKRIMAAQLVRDQNIAILKGINTLEINPDHQIIKVLKIRVSQEKGDEMVRDLIWLLYEVAMLLSGEKIDEPDQFEGRVCRTINLVLSVKSQKKEQERRISKIGDNKGEGFRMDEVD